MPLIESSESVCEVGDECPSVHILCCSFVDGSIFAWSGFPFDDDIGQCDSDDVAGDQILAHWEIVIIPIFEDSL